MSLLPREGARLQAELQEVETEIANRTQQQQSAQQALTAAQNQVTGAQAALAAAQGQLPPLEAAAARADDQVAAIDQEIAEAQQEPEPDRSRLIRNLMKRRNTAQAAAASARTALNNGTAAVDRANLDLQTAQNQVNGAAATLQAATSELAAAGQRRQTVQEQLARLERWNAQIAADPLDRPALQLTERELAERTAALEEACDTVGLRLEAGQEALAILISRRDAIPAELNPILAALPGASTTLQDTQQELNRINQQLTAHFRRGPRP
jgi:chromosome segregation ATPase